MINEVAEVQKHDRTAMGTSTTSAAILSRPGAFTWQEIDLTAPAETQVLVKLQGCGLCASSIPVWEGREWFSYPLEPGAPGHEAWGVVEKLGKDVKGFAVGDRVAMLSYHGFATYDFAEYTAMVKLPESLHDHPFPGEPLGCAMNIFERSDIQKGHTVAIVGIGFLGALLTQLAKAAGAHVIAVSARPFSLAVAKEQGADHCILMDDHYRIIEAVKELTQGQFCDRVIEATGKEWPLNLAGELTKIRGKLIVAGFHQDGMRSVNMQLWNWRGIDVINAHEREESRYIEGMQKAVGAVVDGRINPTPLYTHDFSLDQISTAFELMVARPDGFVKAILRYDR